MSFAERLKHERTVRKLSQQKLAEMVGVHYTNIGRYEREEMKPSAETVNKVANALNISADYLMNGTMKEKASNGLTDELLLGQFKEIEKLPEDKKRLLSEFLDAFIFKSNIQQQFS